MQNTITFPNDTNNDWHHTVTQALSCPISRAFSTPTSGLGQFSTFSFSLSFIQVSNGQSTSIIRHFCSISFNTGLLCSILLSICILKSHGSLLLVDSYTGCGSWLLYVDSFMYTGCGSCNTCKVICHPCHNPAFHIQDNSQ